MIFDSLNLNKTEYLNITENSKQDASSPLNIDGSDQLIEDITGKIFSSDTKGNLNLTFNQYLDSITETNGILAKTNLSEELPISGNLIPLIIEDATIKEDIELSELSSAENDLPDDAFTNIDPYSIEGFHGNDANLPINAIVDKEMQSLAKEIPVSVNEVSLLVNDNSKTKLYSSEKLVNLDSSRVIHQITLVEQNVLEGKLTLEKKLNLNVLSKDVISNEALNEKILTKEKIGKEESTILLNRNLLIEETSPLLKGKDSLDSAKLADNPSFTINLTNISKSVKSNLENISIDSKGTFDLIKTDVNENSLLTQFNTVLKPLTEQNLLPESIVIKQPLHTNGKFTNGLGIRIQWMLQQALSSAEIMLHPPELGPLNVKLVQAGSEMNITFLVQTAQGKDAIEDNLAKLKEMLLAQGINLGQTEIKHKQKDKDEDKQQQSIANNRSDSDLNENSDLELSGNSQSNVALLDTYI